MKKNTTSLGRIFLLLALPVLFMVSGCKKFLDRKPLTATLDDVKQGGIEGQVFALYSAIIEQGKKDKVRRIEWAVLDWNTPAINFYKKTGAKVLDDWRLVQMDENGMTAFIENLTTK